MANLQRLYNRAPRKCMEVRNSPPPQRCGVSVEEVERYFRAKYIAPWEQVASATPPFPIWDHPRCTDVLENPISVLELKRVLHKMDGNTAPGPDRIGYQTWKHLEADHKIILDILNTCRTNGKIPLDWKTANKTPSTRCMLQWWPEGFWPGQWMKASCLPPKRVFFPWRGAWSTTT